jgi:hypothetical protein
LFAVGLAFTRRGPPDLEHWRYGLLAIAIMYAVVAAFVYPYMFGTIVLWVWAGIVYAASPAARPATITIRRREQLA